MRNLEEVKVAIEQWFIALGYDNKERAEKQYLKIIAEVGEMADALCKEDHENFKSEVGDVFVTIVGYCLQKEYILNDLEYDYDGEPLKEINDCVENILDHLISYLFDASINYLHELCISQRTTLLECATIAYNKIQARLENGQLKVINGTIQK